MKTVWKFELNKTKYQELAMPKGADILFAAIQDGVLVVWAMVTSTEEKETRRFELVGTGEKIDSINVLYINTLQFANGAIVKHLFEILPGPANEQRTTTSKKDELREDDKSFRPNFISEFKNKLFGDTKSKMVSYNQLEDKILGLIFGHALGDAIGLATEFMTKDQVHFNYPNGIQYFDQFISDKHRKRWNPGEWTDDTDQMLCILDSLLNKKHLDSKDIAQRIYSWAFNGGRGLGNTVYNVISAPDFLSSPHKASSRIWENSGKQLAANGAVMRTSILGAWQFRNDDAVIKNAEEVAKITHFDPRCVGSSVIISLIIAKLLQGVQEQEIIKIITSISDNYDSRINNFIDLAKNKSVTTLLLDESVSIGYTLKAMASGIWALQQKNYKRTILDIIYQGGDADTNAAVAGAVLGAKLGYEALPKDWLKGLIGKEILNTKFKQLISLMKDQGQY